MILIADSGSTKTSWILIDQDNEKGPWETIGLNPYFHDQASISSEIKHHLVPKIKSTVEEVFFYGSGCKSEDNQKLVSAAIREHLPDSTINIDHDLIGAARSLAQNEAGIVCILGTGSNSCIYDGEKIIENKTSLGFVLGDEGSGAVLGKELIRDYLYKKLPSDLQQSFADTYPMDLFDILNRVYMQPFPNRFLAKFSRFLYEHRHHEYIKERIHNHFSRFIKRNVEGYHKSDLPVYFLGSIALHFREELEDQCRATGISIGEITNDALPGLIRYHRAFLR